MADALRHRAIRRLWFGQALSSIGDEVYRVGLTWLAVSLIGADVGYLGAAQSAALMILSFVGGRWADGWEPLRTMVRVDVVRAAIVLLPVAVSVFHVVPLSVLVAVALSLSALSAFFDPALQTMLPVFAPDLTILRAATGLMSTTIRLARMVGPAIIGLLSGVIPTVHFFTLDALSFVASAASVHSLRKITTAAARPASERPQSFWEATLSGFRTVRAERGMTHIMWTKAVTGGFWNLAIGLGFALLVQELAPGDVRAFGLLVASYGAGNFAGALYFGNHHRPRPAFLMFAGFALLGVGFVLMGIAPSAHWAMVAAAGAGFAGPMNDLAFSDFVQARFPIVEISRVFRLRLAVETLSTLLCMALAPTLFRVLTVRGTIILCGAVWIVSGLLGLWRLEEIDPSAEETTAPQL
jgi:MFS family permease